MFFLNYLYFDVPLIFIAIKMSKRMLFMVLSLCLLQNASALAAFDDYFFLNPMYRGSMDFVLANDSYAAGGRMDVSFTVSNLENFPVANAFLVIQVVSGAKERVYPTQFAENDSLFFEDVVTGINFWPMESKVLNYSYMIPADLKSGSYRLDAYLETERAPLVGMAHIFLAPDSRVFNVVGGNGTFPQTKILRTTTVFNNASGPVGVGVAPGTLVSGEVFVQNDFSTPLEGMSLAVTVCEWQDMLCSNESLFFEKKYDVPVIAPGRNGSIDVLFTAPERPEAYSIRLELKDRNNRTYSLYRSRIVVKGPTGRIHKMALEPLFMNKGEPAHILLLIGTSPDHYDFPAMSDVKVSATVTDKEGALAYSGSFNIKDLSMANNYGFIPIELNYTADRVLSYYTVCSKIESNAGELLDKYCFVVDPLKYSPRKTELIYNTSWVYASGELSVEVCVKDSSGAPISSEASVLLVSKDKTLALDKTLNPAPCAKQIFKTEPGVYQLIVNDVKTNKQLTYDLNLSDQIIPDVCGDSKCGSTESSDVCCSDCGCPEGMVCSNDGCVSEVTTTTIPGNAGLNQDYLLLGLGVLLLLLIVFIMGRHRGASREEGR